MDGQINWLGWLSFAKNVVTLIIAGFGVYVAWNGLSTWQRQLKGTSQLDVAMRLRVKIHKLKQDIEYFRLPGSYGVLPAQTLEGEPISERTQQDEYFIKTKLCRLSVVEDTFKEIEVTTSRSRNNS